MGRFTFPIADVSAGQEVYPADTYSFEIAEVKGFVGKVPDADAAAAGKTQAHGVRGRVKIVTEGPHKNKGFLNSLYMHNDASQQMTKRFVMAALGYAMSQEKEFNELYAAKDWSYDENGEVGEVWRELTGKMITANVTVGINKLRQEPQNNFAWVPYGS